MALRALVVVDARGEHPRARDRVADERRPAGPDTAVRERELRLVHALERPVEAFHRDDPLRIRVGSRKLTAPVPPGLILEQRREAIDPAVDGQNLMRRDALAAQLLEDPARGVREAGATLEETNTVLVHDEHLRAGVDAEVEPAGPLRASA